MKKIIAIISLLTSLSSFALDYKCSGVHICSSIKTNFEAGSIKFGFFGDFEIDTDYEKDGLHIIEFEKGKSTLIIHPEGEDGIHKAYYFYGEVKDYTSTIGDYYHCKLEE